MAIALKMVLVLFYFPNSLRESVEIDIVSW